MNPGEEEARERFVDGLRILAIHIREGLSSDEVVDSLLTLLIGIFMAHEIPMDSLLERVRYAWQQNKSLFDAISSKNKV